jgi:hypothetical protein
VGYYCNAFSNDLKGDITQLTAGTSNVKDEQGMEIFYDYAITPAVRLIPSYQHIWEPLTAQVATKQSEAMYSWCVPLWRFDLSRVTRLPNSEMAAQRSSCTAAIPRCP